VLFLVQWDDELVQRTDALTLFDTLGSTDKTMHVNPGAHAAVPAYEIQATEEFFEKYLGAPPRSEAERLTSRTGSSG